MGFSHVRNRKRRGAVVPSVRAFVDSVWMDGREDRINITIASCLTLTFSYILRYAYISVYICLSFNNMSILMR